MRYKFRFENLKVWQEARKLNRLIYALTRKFPRDELYAMTSQLRRASLSISNNIAEGAGRNSDKDFAHFLEQSYGSVMEVASMHFLALDEGYATEAEAELHLQKLGELAAQIASLNRTLEVPTTKTPFPRRRP
jgi:four helix bundle protein